MRVDSKGGFVAFLVMIMVMTLNKNCCGASFLIKNTTMFPCNGHRDNECLIADNLELESFMDSHISRMLSDTAQPGTFGIGNPSKKAIPCGTGKPYQQCLPGVQLSARCGTFERDCHN